MGSVMVYHLGRAVAAGSTSSAVLTLGFNSLGYVHKLKSFACLMFSPAQGVDVWAVHGPLVPQITIGSLISLPERQQ